MLTYSGNLIRQHDPDRFLLSVLMPAEYHKALWALFAFNYEVAKTREVVSETTIGLIRLQWWREAIGEIYDGLPIRKHEILDDLAEAIKRYDLPREAFEELIYTREFDLEGVAPETREGLNLYLKGVSATLSLLALLILDEPANDTDVVDISTCYGLVGIARSLPFMLSKGHVMLPQDLLKENNLSPKKICDFNCKDDLVQVIEQLLQTKTPYRKLKSRYLKALQAMTKIYEKKIVANRYNVFDSKMAVPARFMALRVWFASF